MRLSHHVPHPPPSHRNEDTSSETPSPHDLQAVPDWKSPSLTSFSPLRNPTLWLMSNPANSNPTIPLSIRNPAIFHQQPHPSRGIQRNNQRHPHLNHGYLPGKRTSEQSSKQGPAGDRQGIRRTPSSLPNHAVTASVRLLLAPT